MYAHAPQCDSKVDSVYDKHDQCIHTGPYLVNFSMGGEVGGGVGLTISTGGTCRGEAILFDHLVYYNVCLSIMSISNC